MTKTVLQGTVTGARRRGRQKKRWKDNIKEWTGMEFGDSPRAAEDRERWKGIVATSSVVPREGTEMRSSYYIRILFCICTIVNAILMRDYFIPLNHIYSSTVHLRDVHARLSILISKTCARPENISDWEVVPPRSDHLFWQSFGQDEF